jgi:hypothetical protein
MADLADRLADRWGEFLDKHWALRGRRAERFRVRGYRFTGSVRIRWDRMTDEFWARPERHAEPFRVRWYRFTDTGRVRWERLTDKLRPRLDRLFSQGAERGRWKLAWRSSLVLGVSLGVVLMVRMVVLVPDRTHPPAPPNAAPTKSSFTAARGIDIPDVRGMPASDARAQLEGAGLKFAGARAALGAPGHVLWTQPSIGRSVPPDTPVTIVIGVEAERIGSPAAHPFLPRARVGLKADVPLACLGGCS